MKRIKINPAGKEEIVHIRLNPASTPVAYETKVRELIEECGMTREEAEREVRNTDFTLELYYEKGSGLFAVETEAVENADLHSPYTGASLVDEDDLKASVKDFFFLREEDRKGITDSLLLDSGQEILAGTVGDVTVSVIVCGDVRIGWKGQVYKSASQFPDDLTEAIRTGSFYVGQDEDEENFIGNNNWYEVRVWRDKTLLEEDVADIDISEMSDDDARGFIVDCAAEYTDN